MAYFPQGGKNSQRVKRKYPMEKEREEEENTSVGVMYDLLTLACRVTFLVIRSLFRLCANGVDRL